MSQRHLLALPSFRQDSRGVAAVEFSIAATLVIVGILNAVDLGLYEYRRMEVENAAQVGAQAAWKACYDTSAMLPATTKCAGLNDAITAAIQSTSLGTAVSLTSGYPTGGLLLRQHLGCSPISRRAYPASPLIVPMQANSSASPGDYIQVSVSYAYAPLFSNLTVMGASGISSISMTSWMRLG